MAIYRRKTLFAVLALITVLSLGTGIYAQEGSSLRMFVNDRPETSYIAHGAITGTGEALFNALHCQLTRLDENFNLTSDLAESWELSDDGTTYTFHLNPDAKWHDGEPVTADDVEFSWVAYAVPEARAGSRARPPVITSVVGGSAVIESATTAVGYADTTNYAGIEVVDEHTINFTLNGPDPLWLITSSQSPNGRLLPKHILGDVPYDEWKQQPIYFEAPVGCGPYQFGEHVEGQYVELDAFPEYHLGAPKIDRIFFQNWLTEDVGIAQIQTGELDMMLGISPADAQLLEESSDAEILTVGSSAAYQLSVNTLRVPDTRVRQAIAHAIDREGINEAIFLGQGKVQECCFLNDWAIPEGQTPYSYDPDLARQLLAEAEWDSSQVLSILFPLDYRLSDVMVPILQQQLAEVGIQTQIDAQESTAFRQKLIETKEWDLFFNQGANMLPDPGSFTVWECATGGFAQSGWIYCDDHFAELYREGRTTTDPEARQEIYQQIQTIFYEEMPTVNIVLPLTINAVKPGLQGVTPTANRAAITWNIQEWSWSE
ncbi:MAG: ABC transporter substrate-binding protein [Anaerolineae bacterium]|nr:ABC transporter substrate-binding protein [Anaerolineae bacterium]